MFNGSLLTTTYGTLGKTAPQAAHTDRKSLGPFGEVADCRICISLTLSLTRAPVNPKNTYCLHCNVSLAPAQTLRHSSARGYCMACNLSNL
jgi:hypothetical protein